MAKTLKILIVYDVPGWAHHNRALALQKYAPLNFQVDICQWSDIGWDNLRQYELIFTIDQASFNAPKLRAYTHSILVTSHNSDRNRRHSLFVKTASRSDFTICNNKSAFEFFGRRQKTCYIGNGVDTEFWKSYEAGDRPYRVLWTGSENPRKGKGYDDVIKPLESLLSQQGIPFDFRPIKDINDSRVMNREQMRDWYNTGRYILCSSHSEATPNTTLEGMACGCIPVTTAVGNIVDIGQGAVVVERDAKAFLVGISEAIIYSGALLKECQEVLKDWGYNRRARVFFDLFRRLIAGEAVKPFAFDEPVKKRRAVVTHTQ